MCRSSAEPLAGGEGCLLDAATAPLDDFRYRFGPLQEREQKRQYATSGDIAREGLAWTYTLLGADAKQLATYNGVQGAFCGQDANTVWMWPAEYNSYGPAQSRIITRPQGAKEFPIVDHLGSTRLTLSQTGAVLQRLDYEPFGAEINEAGDGARTSYIGREKDNESDLGFYGVRMYEPEYGRFMCVDPLWGKYFIVHPYQYGLNSPILMGDEGGREASILNDESTNISGQDALLMLQSAQRTLQAAGDFEGAEMFERLLCDPGFCINVFITDDPTVAPLYNVVTNTLILVSTLGASTENSAISPLVGFVHELSHGLDFNIFPAMFFKTSVYSLDNDYDSRQEERAIAAETRAARALGQLIDPTKPTRIDSEGTLQIVPNFLTVPSRLVPQANGSKGKNDDTGIGRKHHTSRGVYSDPKKLEALKLDVSRGDKK